MTMVTNTKIGEDISFETIRRDFDAVCVGIGAWVSTGVRCKERDAEGVIGGIDFLRKVVRNEPSTWARRLPSSSAVTPLWTPAVRSTSGR